MKQLIVEAAEVKNRSFAISAHGTPLGVYSAADERSAKLAHYADVGHPTVDDVAAIAVEHGKSLEEWMDEIKAIELPLLADRISIVNAKFVNDEGVHIAFDIAVDGTVVHSTLEWLYDNLELKREDCHLDSDSFFLGAIVNALADDREFYDFISTDAKCGIFGDAEDVVFDKLVAAHAELKAKMVEDLRLDEFWYIYRRGCEGGYYVGSEAKASVYCEILDEMHELEFDKYWYSEVSLSEAFSQVDYCFDLIDEIARLKPELVPA